MDRESLDFIPLWLFFVGVCVFAGLALEGGYRFGRWRHARVGDEEKTTPIGAMVGPLLALFAFMLAFTFGLAASRFEARRQAVLDEANAIEVAFLRAGLLPKQELITESRKLLREYVDVRVHGVQEHKLTEVGARSKELHELLWLQAGAAAKDDRGPVTALFIQSLNHVIDLHAKRVHFGVRSRIPISIWVGLFGLAILAMGSVGYQSGLSATRRSPIMLALVLAFSGVLFLIANLDRAHEGVLSVSQQALIDVQKSMTTATPPETR